MITACIHACSEQRHVNVNGLCFTQTSMIKNEKYTLLLKFHPEKTGSTRGPRYNLYCGVTICAITGFYCNTIHVTSKYFFSVKFLAFFTRHLNEMKGMGF